MSSSENSLLSAQSLLAFGLPAVVVQSVIPKLYLHMRQYPRIARLLPYVITLLSALGAIAYGIRPLYDSLVKYIWSWLPEIELRTDDPLYRYLNKHVNSKAVHTEPNKWIVSSTVKKRKSTELDIERSDSDSTESEKDEGGDRVNIVYDNPSSRFFYHKGTLFKMDTPNPETNSAEIVSIRAVALSYKSLHKLLEEAWLTHRTQSVATTTEVLEANFNRWQSKKHRLVRKLNTVDIDDDSKTNLIQDIARYLSPATKSWYQRRGIPHRRGYLFYGPPGTGKSSLAAAVAGHFQAKLYTISLVDPNLHDQYLLELMSTVDKGSVILLEDIDSSGIKRGDSDLFDRHHRRSNVTLSGLLNALDGAAAPEGHILIMSTNIPDALDPALVRAGRVDVQIEFKNASRTAAAKVFTRMMSDDEDDEKNKDIAQQAQQFVERIPEKILSPAEIQGYLLDHARDAQGAIENVAAWVEELEAKRKAQADAKEAAEKSKNMEAQQKEKEVELLRKKNELEEQALARREAAAERLEQMEQNTKEVQLRAEQLRAESEIAKYQTAGKVKLDVRHLGVEPPMTPGQSDCDQDSVDEDRKMQIETVAV